MSPARNLPVGRKKAKMCPCKAAHANPENLSKYKMNITMTITELKRTVVEMLATTSNYKRERLPATMATRLMKAVVPVHPNRSEERRKRHKAMKLPTNSKRIG